MVAVGGGAAPRVAAPAAGLELSRLQNGSQEPVVLGRHPELDHELQNKVQKLNRAIEDVRRQLESLTPKT